MKKTFFSIVLMSALFAVVSCSKSFDPSKEGTSNAKVFTATIEEGTKTTLSGNKVNWVVDDQISIKDNSNNCAIYKAKTGGTTTTNFEYVSGETSLTSPYTAYYPSSLLVETNPTLPATQIYDATYPFSIYPMYASSNDLNLSFKNICGVLAITIQGITVKTINVSSSNKAMSGSFTVDDNTAVLTNPNNASNSVTLNCGEGVLTSSEGTIFYIPIPAQTYNDIRIIVNNESYMVTKKSSIEIARNTIYSFTYSGTDIPTPTTLSGEFSVSSTKKVKFSKGNLQASIDASGIPTAWKFAENQYTYLGSGGANRTIGTAAGDIDLFGWSTDAGTKSWGINASTNASDYAGSFVDWSTNPALISALGSGWYTLSYDEWSYLLSSRTNASSLYKYGVKVCGKTNCLVLAPDDYDYSKLQSEYSTTSTPLTWAQAEAEGLVCFPAAGYRAGNAIGTTGNAGICWSSTPTNTEGYAYILNFNNTSAAMDNRVCTRGHSVRLVRTYTTE